MTRLTILFGKVYFGHHMRESGPKSLPHRILRERFKFMITCRIKTWCYALEVSSFYLSLGMFGLEPDLITNDKLATVKRFECVSTRIPLQSLFNLSLVVNSVGKQTFVSTPHRHSTIVSLKTNPLIYFVFKFSGKFHSQTFV